MAADAVGVLTLALPVLPVTSGAGVFELAQLLVGRERRLGRHFAQQYVAAGGLRPACLDRCQAGAITVGSGSPMRISYVCGSVACEMPWA